jgi:hypothetical protein
VGDTSSDQVLKDRWESQKVTFMFNVKNKETPENMANMFSLSNNEKYELKKERHYFSTWKT